MRHRLRMILKGGYRIVPQVYRVGDRRPITVAVFKGKRFICYTRSLCQARKMVDVFKALGF